MKNITTTFLFVICSTFVFGQTENDKKIALEKANQAIKLMDENKFNESIKLLEESEKLDPNNFDYAYEKAYAYYLQKDYEKAINILEKSQNYKNVNYQLYQLVGNAYDLLGKPEKAIESYDLGISKFPNKGALFLEKGVVYEYSKKYDEAISSYKQGIDIDPKHTSNYYRLSKLYLQSNNKVPGLIYGEIFMNLERTTKRTLEISKLLFDGYKNAIIFVDDKTKKIDFCEVVIDAQKFEKDKKLPFCMIFGKNILIALTGVQKMDLDNLAKVRNEFLKLYIEKDYKDYPNFLLSYLKKVFDNNHFNAYNHYVFQMGAKDEFKSWQEKNEDEYEKFVDWYTTTENIINPTKEDYYKYEY